ncbi:unnamed protein product, partial [Gulo gulo]
YRPPLLPANIFVHSPRVRIHLKGKKSAKEVGQAPKGLRLKNPPFFHRGAETQECAKAGISHYCHELGAMIRH